MYQIPFWSKKMVVAGGDTVPYEFNDYYEGEIDTTESSDLMLSSGYVNRVQKLFASTGTLKRPIDVVRAMRSGAGFVHLSGHGNPLQWATYKANDNETWIIGIDNFRMPFIMNGNRLPIVVVGGCHNSQFNVTPLNFIEGITGDSESYFSLDDKNHPGDFYRTEYLRECMDWRLVSTKNGGAIATIGNTGLGYGYAGQATTAGLAGWIELRFFDSIVNQGKTTVGQAHSQAITDYVSIINGVNSDMADRKTVDGWVLLGDPSLQIGGYTE